MERAEHSFPRLAIDGSRLSASLRPGRQRGLRFAEATAKLAPMPLQVAIVGAGPAGLYAAERLLRDSAGVTVIDRLPSPYGLVRYGVAGDHQSTKNVERVLSRVFQKGAAYVGGVTLGTDVTLDELRQCFDAVLLATGAPRERRLGVPGEDLPHVFGSLRVTGLMNAHPDHAAIALPTGVREVVIVGAGNVALDVARLLAKQPDEFGGSDVDPALAETIAAWPLQRIHVVARRGAGETRFTPLELSELGKLARARPVVDPADLPPADGKILALFHSFTQMTEPKPVEILFHFNRSLRSIGPHEVELTTGERLPADLVVTAIGQEAGDLCGLPLDGGHLANTDGHVRPGIYAVGWAKRGGTGVIGTNRNESQEVAELLLRQVQPDGKGGAECLAALLRERGITAWSFDDWQKLDAAEKAAAPEGRVRRKLWRGEEFSKVRGG